MKRPNCIISGCTRPQKTRGLCEACANHYRRAVREERLTEEHAIAIGILLPKQPRGAPRNSKFESALLNALKNGDTPEVTT